MGKLLKKKPIELKTWVNKNYVSRFYFWGGSKFTADGDGSHEIKRRKLKDAYSLEEKLWPIYTAY